MIKELKDYLNNDHTFSFKKMIEIIFLIVVIAGFFGWIYEFIFYYFNGGMHKFYWRGGNFLPWINVYATGSVIIFLLTYKIRKKPMLVFLLSGISTGILEYFSGYMMLNIMHKKCWDYNTEILNFGNIDGFVCLRSVLVFSFSALLLMYVVVPLIFKLAKKLSDKTFTILAVTLFSIIMFDEFYNLIISRAFSLPRAYDVYKKIGFNYVHFK